MTHILEMFPPSKYVAAFELRGTDTTLTIKRVVAEIIEGENNRKDKRPIVYFEEGGKPLVLNKTNAKILIKLYGADYAAWPGKRITIYPTTVKAFGDDNVEAIRIRPVRPSGAAKTQHNDGPPNADDIIATIKAKNTIAGVDKVWQRVQELSAAGTLDAESLDRIELTREARLNELREAK